ncbi:MAG TPA: hypothetical protein VMY37_06305 [Thermoguttaceae bacterium]|nr:hypothetical protein [Thermoguttaceae bacterium]
MSDELDRLQRQLERATASECSTDGSLDAETASLREGWVALGELLEAAEPSREQPLELREPLKPGRRTGRKVAGIVALAASLLVGVTLAGKWIRANRPGRPATRSDASLAEIVQADGEQFNPDAGQLETASLADWVDWDDPLDQQIASVAQEVVRIQQDWDQVDGAFGPLYSGLEEMAEELDESPL